MKKILSTLLVIGSLYLVGCSDGNNYHTESKREVTVTYTHTIINHFPSGGINSDNYFDSPDFLHIHPEGNKFTSENGAKLAIYGLNNGAYELNGFGKYSLGGEKYVAYFEIVEITR